jgi:amino acid transporter
VSINTFHNLKVIFQKALTILRNTGLYITSRTLFALAQNYGNTFINDKLGLGRTNNGHTPLTAIICCSLFGLLALAGLKDESFNQV